MTGREFAYWLQGYFEIKGTNINSITLKQSSIIYDNLVSVKRNDTTKSNEKDYCDWLLGCYDKEQLPTTEIVIRLNGLFEHVIDATYGDKEVQDRLSNIHHGRNDRRVRIKC